VRILIYGLNFAPELTGIGKYTGEMVTWLRSQGHHICVVTTPPYYPAWQVGEGYSTWWYGYEETERLKIYRCPLWVPKSPSGLKRILHLFSFALTSLPVALWMGLWWRPDLVWVAAPAIFSAPGAWLAGLLGGGKTWLHIQDFEIDAAFDLGLLGVNSDQKNSRLRHLVSALERWLLRRFDHVSTIAPAMLKILEAKGVEPAKLVFFPNWVDTEIIYPLDTPSPMRYELGIPLDRIVVLYSGNMGKKQGLEIAIASAQLLSTHPNILFVLCGDGVMRSQLEQVAEGLDNLMFLPLQPLEKLNDLLNLADIHILPQRSDVADLVMPSKLGGILACGGAAIATAHPHTEVANVVQAAGGMVCLPDDAQHFAEAILALAQDPVKRDSMQQSARSYTLQNLAKEEILSNFHRYCQQ
jgi:colanic acid biosynthesis glycosyl transferase WcaI